MSVGKFGPRRLPRRPTGKAQRPGLETLEARRLLAAAPLVVSTTADAGPGSLRQAISTANASGTAQTIDFAITTGTAPYTIVPTSALPAITVPVTIDATGQAGYAGTPVVVLDGTSAGASVDGLDVAGGSSTIAGLAVVNFSGSGVKLYGQGGDTLRANFIGINPTADAAAANGGDGVLVFGISANTIGGLQSSDRNVISGNAGVGIHLDGNTSPAPTPTLNNLIVGNLIGTNSGGTSSVPNGTFGISIDGAANTTIGGTTAAARNLISGNKSDGIDIGVGDHSLVEGNYVGTDVTGRASLGNGGAGLNLKQAFSDTIGGTTAGAGNLISGNVGYGVDSFVNGGTTYANTNDLIEGNLIGTDAGGTKAVANGGGVRIVDVGQATIGGTGKGAGNVISGNAQDGINTFGAATGLVIQGNFIGTDAGGTLALGNGNAGIDVFTNTNLIGGLAPGAGNVIAFNGAKGTLPEQRSGIEVLDDAGTTILSNSIHDNVGLGIDLVSSSANHGQVAPTLTSAAVSGSQTVVTGTLQAAANTTYTVQFFSNPTADSSGAGEGQTLLGTISAPTDANGLAKFDATNASFATMVPPGSAVSATATAPSGDTSAFSTDVASVGSADLSISVSGTPASIPVGGTATYTVTVTNLGPTSTDGVEVTDSLPVGATFVSATASQGTAVLSPTNATQVLADVGTLASGASATITIVVQAGAASSPSMTDSAQVTNSSQPDPDASNDQASATTTVTAVADLKVGVVASAASVAVGQNLTYTITVANNGPSDAPDVVLTDTLPTNVAFVSLANSNGAASTRPVSGVITDDLGALPAGAKVKVTIVITPLAASVGTITDTASVATVPSTVTDPNPADNTAAVKTTVTPVADLGLSISSPAAVVVGGNITYTLTVTNQGPSPATNVTINDMLPGNTTFVSISPNPGGSVTPSGGTVSEDIGTLQPGDSATVTIVVATSASSAGTATDSAAVSATEADPNTADNTGSASTAVKPQADLAISVSAPAASNVGQNLTYTVNVSNGGPSAATGVTVSDVLPANVTFVSASSAQGQFPAQVNGVVSANLGTLAAGGTATLTIVVTPLAAAVGTLSNTVGVSANESDPVATNNTASASSTISPSADLALSVLATPNPVLAGTPETYTMTLTNNGLSDASGLRLTDTLPAGATFVSISPTLGVPIAPTNGVVTLSLGTLPANGSTTVTLVILPASVGTTLTNTATLTSDEFDPVPQNNTAVSTTTVTPVANLAAAIAATPVSPTLGQSVTYTVTVTNQGPSEAPGVVLNDALPPGVTLGASAASQGSVATNGNTLSAAFGTLAPGASATLTFSVTPNTGGLLVDSAAATANIFDTTPQNGSASLSLLVTQPPGMLQIAPASVTVPENAGAATFVVTRTNGTQGQVTVHYATAGGNARPGIDYTPVSGTLVFTDGQTSQTITVPVLANPNDSHDETVGLEIDSPTGGATLGAQTTSALTIQDIDPNYIGPNLSDVGLSLPRGKASTSIVLDFTRPLDPASASRLSNYVVTDLGRSGTLGAADNTRMVLTAALYNPSANTVTLVAAAPFRANHFYEIHIQGAGPGAITGVAGNPLNSSPAAPSGANIDESIGMGTNLAYVDEFGHRVTIGLRGAGVLLVTRDAAGEGQRLAVLGAVAGRTTLTGRSRGGQTTFQTITGLGYFGDVLVKMSTPPFFVVQPSYPPARLPAPNPGELKATSVPAGPLARSAAHAPLHRHAAERHRRG